MPEAYPTRITIADAAQILGLSTDTVRRRISEGALQAYRVGRGPKAPIRLDLDEVLSYARPIATVRAGQ